MNLIIVDDEPLVAHTLVEILNGEGHHAVAFLNGPSAIKAAETIQPDAVIIDVIMPEMDGIETAKAILNIAPCCRVILFSGQAASTDLLEQANAQGYGFEVLAKPIKPTVLLATLTDNNFSAEKEIRKI